MWINKRGDIMIIRAGIDYLFRTSDDSIKYLFFNTEGICCITKANSNQQKEIVVKNCSSQFCASIDDKDVIHLIALMNNGTIIYLKNTKGNWVSNKLSAYNTQKYIIKCPYIIVSNNKIHIFMYISNMNDKNICTLIHYYWNKKSWSKSQVAKLKSDINNSSISYYLYKDSIYLVYSSLEEIYYQIYLIQYSCIEKKWSLPINISNSNQNCSNPQIMISNEKAHFVWLEQNIKFRVVRYYNSHLNSLNKPNISSLLSMNTSDSSIPYFIIKHDTLIISWTQENVIKSAISKISDIPNFKYQKLNWSKREIKLVYFKDNYQNDAKITKSYLSYDKNFELPYYSLKQAESDLENPENSLDRMDSEKSQYNQSKIHESTIIYLKQVLSELDILKQQNTKLIDSVNKIKTELAAHIKNEKSIYDELCNISSTTVSEEKRGMIQQLINKLKP